MLFFVFSILKKIKDLNQKTLNKSKNQYVNYIIFNGCSYAWPSKIFSKQLYFFFFLYALMAYHIELNIFLKNQNIFLIRSQRF